MLGNSSSGKELSPNTNALALVASINNISERARRSDDGKGSSNIGDSELVKTVGMRTDGCSVTGCMEEGSSSDSNEAVEGRILRNSRVVASELVTGLEVGNISVPLGWADSSNSVEGCNMNSLLDNSMSLVGELTGSSTIVLGSGNSKVVDFST